MKLTCCLDTSAVNALLDEASRATFSASIRARLQVLVTSINLVEVIATPSPERRMALLSLLKELANNTRPLAMPNKLLRRASRAYARKKGNLTITVTEEDAAFWHVLQHPQDAGESEREEAS